MQENFSEAITDCTHAIDLHPHYLKAILRRAELYQKSDKLDDALKDHQRVVELDPGQHASREACMVCKACCQLLYKFLIFNLLDNFARFLAA